MNATMNKWASLNSSKTCVNGKNSKENIQENVNLKLMTSLKASPCSKDTPSSRLANVTSSLTSSSSVDIIRTDTLSQVPASASAHVIPDQTESADPDTLDRDSNEKRPQPGSPSAKSVAATMIRKNRFTIPSPIATNSQSVDSDIYETPKRNRKKGIFSRYPNSASASPSATTPSTPVNSGGGLKFKFPAVKMGGFFRKKCSCPSLNYAAQSGVSADAERSPSPSALQKRQKNRSPRKNVSNANVYNNVTTHVSEISPLLKRINNRLGLDDTASSRSQYRVRGGPAESCYCLDDCYHRHHLVGRCTSKEDPGPRTEVHALSAMNEIMASLMIEGMTDASCANSACNKSASYPTAFGSPGRLAGDIMDGAGLPTGAKYKLVKEGQIQICRLNHPRTLLGKLTSSKLLRRWETHTLILESDEMKSKTPFGFMEQTIKYSFMEDVHALPQWDSNADKHCVRIFVPEGSVLLQTSHVYARNQWLYSILWRRNMYRYRRVIESNCNRPEVLLTEIKSMVEQALRTPLQGDRLSLKPVRLACIVLNQISDGQLPKTMIDPVLVCVAPLLDTITAVSEISPWLSKYCEECPRSRLIDDVLSDVANLTLKKNMDFGKYTSARHFVQDFLLALNSQNGGLERVKVFVRNAHGPSSACPHPRMLPNLVSVCLAAVHALYDSPYGGSGTKASTSPSISTKKSENSPRRQPCQMKKLQMKMSNSPVLGGGDTSSLSSGSMSGDDRVGAMAHNYCIPDSFSPSIVSASSSIITGAFVHQLNPNVPERTPEETQAMIDHRLSCFCTVLETISEFEDWRLPLASLLQPIPFPDEVLANESFVKPFGRLIRRIGTDTRCEVHLAVLGVREGKEGWFHLVCPGGPLCSDDGDLFATLLKTLLHCCCRRKKFLQSLNAMLGPLQLLSLRECEPAMEALCHMLELEVVEGEDLKLQMITALQSTPAGKRQYTALCDRQIALRELQQKGGPRKLTLPSKSTDADLGVLLSSGSFGNLEWLSLAFTNVTSACAEYLIKLPALRYLNLWSTQFGDVGLQMISEHLHKLQVLNLCETPVTDKGLNSLASLTNLRKLNLNSTQLSAKTFQYLRAKLPALQEVDVRYTDAWCADEFLAWPSSQ